jgi:formylmethanofuran dehydrogenase subunit E
MGYVAARSGLAWLREGRAEDEEIVAVVETDACGSDAVQVITGCTFGKGNFLFKDYGKMAFSFLSRATEKGIRLCAKPNAFSLSLEHRALFEKVRSGTASEDDMKTFWASHRERTLHVLGRRAEDLYTFQEAVAPLPDRAMVFESLICSRCGESVMSARLTETGGGLMCRACQEAGNQG